MQERNRKNYMLTNLTTWKKWAIFLRPNSPPKLNQEVIDQLNRLITRSEIESQKNTTYKKKSRTRWPHRWILPNKRINTHLFFTCPKVDGEVITLRRSMKSSSPQYQSQTKILPKKKISQSLMNIDAKILNKILANQIQQQTLKKIIHLGVPVVAQWLTNLTRNHEVEGSIPGLAQWVKDLALL